MNKIAQAALLVVNGQLRVETQPNYCLRATREIVEYALGWSPGTFFTRAAVYQHLTPLNRRQAPSVPWARSAEQAFMDQEWTASAVRAGDLLFARVPVDQGHVGVAVVINGAVCVVENTTARRGTPLGGALRLTRLADWNPVTTIGRPPTSWGAEVPDPAPPAPVLTPLDAAGARLLVDGQDLGLIDAATLGAGKLQIRTR